MATSYREILESIVARLKADSGITDLLTARTIGGTSSKANNIFTGDIPDPIVLPCISLRDFGPAPANRELHEDPFGYTFVDVEVSVFGEADDLYAIQAEIDESFEDMPRGTTAMADSSNWTFKDIDTSGEWTHVAIPKTIRLEGSGQNTEQRSKTYSVKASWK